MLVNASAIVYKGDPLGVAGGDAGDPGRGTSTGAHCHFWITQGAWRLHPDEDIEWGSEGDNMQPIIDSLNKAWALLDQIQQHPDATPTIIDLAEQVKQQVVVEIKIAVGLQ